MIAPARPGDPFAFFSRIVPGASTPGAPLLDDLLIRMLPNGAPDVSPPAPIGTAPGVSAPVPIGTVPDTVSNARLSAMLRQDYARPEPAAPSYPPIRGLGYRIPILPEPDRSAPSFFEQPVPSEPSPSNLFGFLTPRRAPASAPPAQIDRAPNDPLLPSMPPQVPSLTVEQVGTRSGRIAGAARRAVADLFEAPLGLSDETMGPLINQGPEDFQGARGAASLFRTFNKVFIQGGSQVLDAAGRSALAPLVGGIAAVTQAAREVGMSETGARKLERDLNAIAVSASVASGGMLGGPPRVPWPRRVLAEADLRGVIDDAVRTLPREARTGVKEKLRDAFKAGEEAGKEAAEASQAPEGIPKSAAISASPESQFVSKPPLATLPDSSPTVNPMTAEEFRSLPQRGKIDPHRIRTLQNFNNDKFRPEKGDGQRKSVLEMTNQLRTIPDYENKVPEIRIFEFNGNVFTLDHRRLVSHRLADVQIRYRKAKDREIKKDLDRKNSTEDNGMTIKILSSDTKREK